MHFSKSLCLSLLGATLSSALALPTHPPSLIARDPPSSSTAISVPSPTPNPTAAAGDGAGAGEAFTTSTIHVTVAGFTNAYATVPAKTIDIGIPACVRSGTPDANGYLPPGTCGAIYDYYPSFAAAVMFALMFGLLTATHIWQAARHRKRFCWVVIMAGIWETMAFMFRAISTKNQQSVGVYLVFQIFILLAPLWVNAFDYMLLGRIIWYFTPERSLFSIPAPTIALIFVSLDIVTFTVQLVGGVSAGPDSSAADQLKALHIYEVGIGMQQLFIVAFVGLIVMFCLRMKSVDRRAEALFVTGQRPGWMWLVVVMLVSLSMITTRIIFRFFQQAAGANTGAVNTDEAYFYVLEGTPMFLAILSFNIVHPGKYLVGPESETPGLWSTIRGRCEKRKRKEFEKVAETDSESVIIA